MTRIPLLSALIGGLAALASQAVATPAPAASAPAMEPICVFLLPEQAGEALINRCRICREVTLERVRAGEGVPSVRAMMLPGEAVTPAPFRGPGRTRIVGERSCPVPAGRSTSGA
jgi:hypothetical protein